MGNKLLIRAYNVGCGDCIYVRIPGRGDGFHILIDCGKKGDTALLKKAVEHLAANELPAGKRAGTKRLDLIVATHRHEDHIKGFDPALFEDIEVRNIWMSAVMDPKHPQAESARKLHALATGAMRSLSEQALAANPELALLASLYGVSNDLADKLLMVDLPKANGIEPRYVHAGMSRQDLGLKDGDPTIRVLAPEEDIDHFYLGKEAMESLKGFAAGGDGASFAGVDPRPAPEVVPSNISPADFRLLRSRLMSNGLEFVARDTSIQNNMSVVLLIEWKGRRLLFVGDAEWDGEFRDGKQNGSWNVMWEKRREALKDPIDFLKIGHHGSINATPPAAVKGKKDAGDGSVFRILDALLPVPKGAKEPTAQAIVSTEREFYAPIPCCPLLVELARRVKTRRNYGEEFQQAKKVPEKLLWISRKATAGKFYETYEKEFLDKPQPYRTDLEFALHGRDFIDVEIEP